MIPQIRRVFQCNICKDTHWVCEEHPNIPWEECCEGAGTPCVCSKFYNKEKREKQWDAVEEKEETSLN